MPTIAYLDTLPAQNGLDMLHSQTKVNILKINSFDSEEKCLSILKKADAYQVGAARDEVPKYLQVDKDFLKKLPNLIVISSSGAGYDTIDVDACSDAGVLVVNQTGGNAEGVAEHAVGMILSLFKRIGECDHALRRGWNEARISLMGKDLLLRGTKKIKHGLLREFSDGEDTYLLDEKGIDFLSKAVIIYGHLSDNKQNVGNISLEFIPNK